MDTAQLLGDISLRRGTFRACLLGLQSSPKAPEPASAIEGKTKKWGGGRGWTLYPWCQQDSPKIPQLCAATDGGREPGGQGLVWIKTPHWTMVLS